MNDLDHWWIMLPLAIVVFLASAAFEERRKIQLEQPPLEDEEKDR